MRPAKHSGVPRALALLTARVGLRPIEASDAVPAFELLHARREVLDWLIWEGPATAAELRVEYGAWCSPGPGGSSLVLAVVERTSGAFAGSVTLKFAGLAGICELGFWLGVPFQGRGLGSELVRAATWLAFERLHAQLVQAVVFVGNTASRRALERCGFARDRELSLNLPGRVQRAWHLAVEREQATRSLGAWRPESCVFELEPGPEASPAVEGEVPSPRTTRP